jgi:multiple antibiotic resistance protein
MTLVSAIILLFFVMDAIGNIPLFLAVLKNVDKNHYKMIIIRELIFAFFILVLFLFFGQEILSALQISSASLSIAGGIILFLIALKMIFPDHSEDTLKNINPEPFIVPLAIPFVAGPSAIATVLLITSREPERWPEWLLALFIAWLITGIILFFSSGLKKILRDRGLTALERLMGMILTTISVEMFLDGIQMFIEN